MSDLDAARQLRRQLRQDHRLLWRMRLARAALLWERVWPAAWPPLAVIGIFAVLALLHLCGAARLAAYRRLGDAGLGVCGGDCLGIAPSVGLAGLARSGGGAAAHRA